MNKKMSSIMAVLLIACFLLTSCSSRNATGDGAVESTQSTTASQNEKLSDNAASIPSSDQLSFPDAIPLKPVKVDSSYYDYDDMSKNYKIEIFTYNYGVALPDPNPISEHMNKKYNVDITYTTVSLADLSTVLNTRFATNDYPDFLSLPLDQRTNAYTLSEQGLLVDALKVLPYMPNLNQYVTKDFKTLGTFKDKMAFIPRYPMPASDRCYAIRTDWLEKFNMQPPKTEEELILYARACTFNDPDGNNKEDTWFMGAAAGGQGFGMLEFFRGMFGHPSFNIKDNKINHPMLDGTTKRFLQFIKKLYDEKVLVPDWYTVDWEKFKSYTMNNKVGMVHYQGYSLCQEYYGANKQNDVHSWDFIEPPMSDGKYWPGLLPNLIFCFSNNLENNQGKLMRVAHLIDNCLYMGEDFFNTVQGGGNNIHPDCGNIEEYKDDGSYILTIDNTKHPGYNGKYGTNNLELAAWQNIGFGQMWRKYTDEGFGEYGSGLNKKSNTMPRWTNFDLRITFDPQIYGADLNTKTIAEELKFVMGERSFEEWDNYVQEWLKRGGDAMLAEAAKQLGVQNYK